MKAMRLARLIMIEVLLSLGSACFHPAYDHPACSSDGKCPAGLTCFADVCIVPPDVPPRCNPLAAFGAPVAITNLNPGKDNASARLSPDELTIYFASRPRLDAPENWDLYMATRANTSSTFSNAKPIGGVNTSGMDYEPTVTANDLDLYATTSVVVAGVGQFKLTTTSRSNADAGFGPLVAMTQLNSSSSDGGPFILPTGAVLYFSSMRDGRYHNIYRAPRSGGDFEAPSVVMGTDIPSLSSHQTNPVPSPDELILYFASTRDGTASPPLKGLAIYRSDRLSTKDAFAPASHLTTLKTGTADEMPSWVSADDCVLYFTRVAQDETFDLYVSTRAP